MMEFSLHRNFSAKLKAKLVIFPHVIQLQENEYRPVFRLVAAF